MNNDRGYTMTDELNRDWWRWRINRKLADFIDRPDGHTEEALRAVLQAYRSAVVMQRTSAPAGRHGAGDRPWH